MNIPVIANHIILMLFIRTLLCSDHQLRKVFKIMSLPISAQNTSQSENALQFGNHFKWINDDLFISCEPRFTEYSKCYRMENKKNIQCKRHGHL